MSSWLDTEKGQEFFKKAFEVADLPEVDGDVLEQGTYTNRQIAEKAGSPEKLLSLLMNVSGDRATKRSILSFAVEMDLED
ncbi:MAG: hypothetical protein HYT98_02225 [Candidatus Sungbacteria bacterium]|nr:hypothetical protein [Candidatus Sungbacteria bacterium]